MSDMTHPLAPVLAVLEPLPTGGPIAAFAATHRVRVWFGWGPLDTGGWASSPWDGLLVLPKAFQEPSEMARLGNVLLVAHELVHAMQRETRGNRLPFPLYREVEAHIAQQVLTWETASLASHPEATRQQAAEALALLTADLASGYAYVLAQGEGMRPVNYYRTPLFSQRPEGGDPLVSLAELLRLPDLPVRVGGMAHPA
ncbi:MAG: hypothetical protein H5T59_13955 [Anaerolineae bacterium]|nr:hypothetical protein [Anaerolineae bacterium]